MSMQGQTEEASAQQQQQQQGRRVELSEQPIDPEWNKRWKDAKARYPDDLLQYAGQVRALFLSPDAPISASDGKVFIVYRTDPANATDVHVEGVYSNIPAANEHVLLCFAARYGNSMGAEHCLWSMKGAPSPAQEKVSEPSAHMVWSYTPHACLELEVVSLPNDENPGTRRVFIVEEWIEEEPPEDLEMSVLGRRL